MSLDNTLKAFGRLLEIMAILRSPGGCPWDVEQTPESLKPYLLEETYEVLEAIDSGNPSAIRDELGDLLLQIVFQARIFEERQDFDMEDVARTIGEKLLRRHPHVFEGTEPRDGETLDGQWDRIKSGEKAQRGESATILAGVPGNLPALLRARKLTERASRVGFDWREADEVFAKVREELAEFEQARRNHDRKAMEDELGDLLFTIVNLGRFLEIDAEEALRQTINRFVSRFEFIEQTLERQGRNFKETTMKELDQLWEKAKEREKRRVPRRAKT